MVIIATTSRSFEQRGVLVITRTVAGSVQLRLLALCQPWREAGSLSNY
jgi:hypothetical protein